MINESQPGNISARSSACVAFRAQAFINFFVAFSGILALAISIATVGSAPRANAQTQEIAAEQVTAVAGIQKQTLSIPLDTAATVDHISLENDALPSVNIPLSEDAWGITVGHTEVPFSSITWDLASSKWVVSFPPAEVSSGDEVSLNTPVNAQWSEGNMRVFGTITGASTETSATSAASQPLDPRSAVESVSPSTIDSSPNVKTGSGVTAEFSSVVKQNSSITGVGLSFGEALKESASKIELFVEDADGTRNLMEQFEGLQAGVENAKLTLRQPYKISARQKIVMVISGGSNFNDAVPTGEKGNPVGLQVYGTPSPQALRAAVPTVAGTPGLERLGSGNSAANLQDGILTISTQQQGAGKVKELNIHTEIAGFTSAGWSLKVDDTVVDSSKYEIRVDGDDVYFTFKEPQEYPEGTKFTATGPWTGTAWTTGTMTLWGELPPPPSNDYVNLKTSPIKNCRSNGRNFFFATTVTEQAGVYVMSVYLPDALDQPANLTDPKIYVKAGTATYTNVKDFTLTLNGRYLSATFSQKIPVDRNKTFSLYLPTNLKTGAYNPCNIQLLGEGTAAPMPTVCSADDRPVDDTGMPMPWSGDARAISSRQPARTLTAEEKARGTSVYVTASTPNSQARNMSQLYLQTQAGAQFQKIGGETGWVVNALAYNPKDNWLYAVSQGRVGRHTVKSSDGRSYQYVPLEDPCFPAGHLLQINPMTGQIYNLGRIVDPATRSSYGIGGSYNQPWPNDLWGGVNSGFVDLNGNYWVTNSSLSGSGHFYKIDLSNRTATPTGSASARCGNDEANYCSRAEDWTALPGTKGNYAWGIKNGWAANNRIVLERMNMNDGSLTTWDITDLRTLAGQAIPTGHQWGKAWSYGNGNLGFGTASAGATSDVVQLKVTNPDSANPTFELVSIDDTAPRSYNSDGTSNGLVPAEVDLEATKTFIKEENGRIYWRIEVANKSLLNGSSGFVLNDTFEQGYSDIKMERTTATQTSVHTSGNSIQIIFGPVPPGSSVSVEISAKQPETMVDGCARNTATIIGNETDPMSGNNTTTAEECTDTPLKIQIQKVDADNHTKTLDAKFELRDPVGDSVDNYVPAQTGTEIVVNADGTSGTADVKTDKYYFLVETKSPSGYSLLPEPMLMRIEKDTAGNPVVKFPRQVNAFPVLTSNIKVDKGLITIPIADVKESGTLPKTGGIGVGMVALLGAAIVGVGLGIGRIRRY
ncbi:LPXTG cell wall anchor domain-containing protein [Corynebacterium ulcerans]|nr:LPXTG cell wall anchor domain-containing protein [Corynebacterium ulcerans]NOM02676.1 LPXTG cell wall anchor domain-containing protein [Corynebacterium ulcerans]